MLFSNAQRIRDAVTNIKSFPRSTSPQDLLSGGFKDGNPDATRRSLFRKFSCQLLAFSLAENRRLRQMLVAKAAASNFLTPGLSYTECLCDSMLVEFPENEFMYCFVAVLQNC